MAIRILVAEDDKNLQMIVQDYLRAFDFDIDLVENGQEALDHIALKVPDLLVADIAMPVMDGLELVRRLRNDSSTAKLPIIALTARAMASDAQEAIQAGCDTFITKPFNPRVMLSEIRRLLHLPDDAA